VVKAWLHHMIAHELTHVNGLAIKPIKEVFGIELIKIDGSLDRDRMRNLVFTNPDAKESLERILHELIYIEVLNRIKTSTSSFIIVVVPLLFKSPKYLALIDKSIFIDCDESKLIERVKLRSKLDENLIRAILDSQTPKEQQLKMADDIIANNGSELELEEKVTKLYYKYTRYTLNLE
jgi:dephospho-CoA kinase